MRRRIGVVVTPFLLAAAAVPAVAQPLGQFRWQQQPFCNVITLNVVQSAGVYQLDGWDDQCGATTRAAAAGLAFQNPDGSIGLGLTIVTTPGGTPLHIDATVSLSGFSGSWRDSTGQNGPWTYLTGGGLGGSPRPAARTAFPAGLSAGSARVTDVGNPVAAGDAANRGYVDAGLAALHASLAAPLNLSAHAAREVAGALASRGFGCLESSPADAAADLEIPLPIGARLTGVYAKFTDESAQDIAFRLVRVSFWDSLRSESSAGIATTAGTPRTGFLNIPLFSSSTLNTVRNDQTFYLRINSPSHTGLLYFCGVQVEWVMP